MLAEFSPLDDNVYVLEEITYSDKIESLKNEIKKVYGDSYIEYISRYIDGFKLNFIKQFVFRISIKNALPIIEIDTAECRCIEPKVYHEVSSTVENFVMKVNILKKNPIQSYVALRNSIPLDFPEYDTRISDDCPLGYQVDYDLNARIYYQNHSIDKETFIKIHYDIDKEQKRLYQVESNKHQHELFNTVIDKLTWCESDTVHCVKIIKNRFYDTFNPKYKLVVFVDDISKAINLRKNISKIVNEFNSKTNILKFNLEWDGKVKKMNEAMI